MIDSAGPDELAVEEALRKILDPLDRQLAWASSLIPLAILTIVPLFFLALWHVYDWRFVRAAPTAVGLCCGFAALYMCWEMVALRVARWRFDRRFRSGTAERGLAVRMLAEMESPSRAELKLRQSLSGISPDRIIRHRRSGAEPRGDTPLANPSTPAERSPGEVQIGPSGDEPSQARRPGGYYDYIPLEPRSAPDDTDKPSP